MPPKDNFPTNSAITRRFGSLKNPDFPYFFTLSGSPHPLHFLTPALSVSLFLRPSEHSGTPSGRFPLVAGSPLSPLPKKELRGARLSPSFLFTFPRVFGIIENENFPARKGRKEQDA